MRGVDRSLDPQLQANSAKFALKMCNKPQPFMAIVNYYKRSFHLSAENPAVLLRLLRKQETFRPTENQAVAHRADGELFSTKRLRHNICIDLYTHK